MAIGQTASTYWKKYKAISPWTAMSAYMATLVLWGILFLEPQFDRLVVAALVIPTGMVLDDLLHRWQTGRPNWQSALITSSIITVLLPPDVDLLAAFLAVFVAIGSKHFLLMKKRHIFNPAAAGVAVSALVFGFSLGWWPDSYLWLTLVFGLLNVWRVKKYPQVLAFLAGYVVLAVLFVGWPLGDFSFTNLGSQSLPLALPFFFALFMLPEPQTSIQPRTHQMIFGLIAVLVAFVASYVPVVQEVALLWGLLSANVYARLRAPG
jgi:enediyne biosynthesis protein E5